MNDRWFSNFADAILQEDKLAASGLFESAHWNASDPSAEEALK
ncbi:MAG: hypothetical protein AAGJ83_00905 [Planctomycetota bacterium]